MLIFIFRSTDMKMDEMSWLVCCICSPIKKYWELGLIIFELKGGVYIIAFTCIEWDPSAAKKETIPNINYPYTDLLNSQLSTSFW